MGAEVGAVVHAEPAVSARGDDRGDDAIARLDAGDVTADLGDGARRLVAGDEREWPGEPAARDGEVGVADPARVDAHSNVVRADRSGFDVFDDEWLAVFDKQGCLHGGAPVVGAWHH
jgi:hypothetical protein